MAEDGSRKMLDSLVDVQIDPKPKKTSRFSRKMPVALVESGTDLKTRWLAFRVRKMLDASRTARHIEKSDGSQSPQGTCLIVPIYSQSKGP